MYVVKPENEEREHIKLILKDLGEYYGRPISDRQLEMYTDDLIELGSELTRKAVMAYRKKWGTNTFPFPAQLRGAISFIHRDLYVHEPRI